MSCYGNEGNGSYCKTCIDFIWQADTSRSKSGGSLTKPVKYRHNAVALLRHTGDRRNKLVCRGGVPPKGYAGEMCLKRSHLRNAPSSSLLFYQ